MIWTWSNSPLPVESLYAGVEISARWSRDCQPLQHHPPRPFRSGWSSDHPGWLVLTSGVALGCLSGSFPPVSTLRRCPSGNILWIFFSLDDRCMITNFSTVSFDVPTNLNDRRLKWVYRLGKTFIHVGKSSTIIEKLFSVFFNYGYQTLRKNDTSSDTAGMAVARMESSKHWLWILIFQIAKFWRSF